MRGQYDVLVTMDRGLEFQQRISTLPFGIILVRARSNRIEDLKPLAPSILSALDAISLAAFGKSAPEQAASADCDRHRHLRVRNRPAASTPNCSAAPTSSWTPITAATSTATAPEQRLRAEPLRVGDGDEPPDRRPRHRRRRIEGAGFQLRPAARLRRARRHLRARLRRARQACRRPWPSVTSVHLDRIPVRGILHW